MTRVAVQLPERIVEDAGSDRPQVFVGPVIFKSFAAQPCP